MEATKGKSEAMNVKLLYVQAAVEPFKNFNLLTRATARARAVLTIATEPRLVGYLEEIRAYLGADSEKGVLKASKAVSYFMKPHIPPWSVPWDLNLNFGLPLSSHLAAIAFNSPKLFDDAVEKITAKAESKASIFDVLRLASSLDKEARSLRRSSLNV